MAVTFDAVGPSSAGTATTGTSLSWSHTCSGTNRLLVVSVSIGMAGGDTNHVTSVTYNSVAMTSIAKVHSNNDVTGYVEMFYLIAPSTGTNTVQVTGNETADMVSGSVSFTGVDQSTPLSNTATNWGSGTNISVSVTSATGNMVVDGVCCGGGFTVGSNQTNRWLKNYNTFTAAGNGAQSTASGSTSVSMGYTISDDWWAIIGTSINQSTALPPVATVAWLTA
jgi:hypothetical protein